MRYLFTNTLIITFKIGVMYTIRHSYVARSSRLLNHVGFKELNLCFQKLVRGELHTLYSGGFPNRGLNPGPWSQAPMCRQQYMGERSNQLSHADNLKKSCCPAQA